MDRSIDIKTIRVGSFRYFKRSKYPFIPLSPSDTYIITQTEDRLDKLAYQYYGESNLWWVIATANPSIVRKDSLYLKPGLEVRIPVNINRIIEDYKRINK